MTCSPLETRTALDEQEASSLSGQVTQLKTMAEDLNAQIVKLKEERRSAAAARLSSSVEKARCVGGVREERHSVITSSVDVLRLSYCCCVDQYRQPRPSGTKGTPCAKATTGCVPLNTVVAAGLMTRCD